MHDSHLVRHFTSGTEEHLMSGYTKQQYTVTFTVGYQTRVTITSSKRLVRVIVYQDTIAFDDGEYLSPSLAIVLADTSVKVNSAITDVGTARTGVGYGQQITFRCLGDGRNTIRGYFRILSGEHFERALFFVRYLLTLFSASGQSDHAKGSNEKTSHFSHSL